MLNTIKSNLKFVMLADGGISLFAGATLAGFSSFVAGLLGPAFSANAVFSIVVFLLFWGIFHIVAGRTSPVPSGAVKIAILGDALWVTASIGLLVADWNALTPLGIAVIAVLTLAVADIGVLKLIGLNAGHRPALA